MCNIPGSDAIGKWLPEAGEGGWQLQQPFFYSEQAEWPESVSTPEASTLAHWRLPAGDGGITGAVPDGEQNGDNYRDL